MADASGHRPPRPGLRPRSRGMGDLGARERAALDELAEVERSLAALEGRNVESAAQNAAALRDAERRRNELQRVVAGARDAARARRKRKLYQAGVIAAGFVALGVAAARAWPSYKEDVDRRTRSTAAAGAIADAFRPLGFAKRDTATGSIEVAGEAGRCFLVAGAAPEGPVRLRADRELTVIEGTGSVAWCSCGSTGVRVTAPDHPMAALVVAHAPASVVGGPDQLETLSPRPGASLPEIVDRACAESAFDAWLASGRTPPEPPAALEPAENRLAAEGLKPRELAGAGRRFLPLSNEADACVLVRARSASAKLSLRVEGGERPLVGASGAIASCARAPATLSAWREGGGEIVAFSAPAVRVGGTLGLRELAARAGVGVTVWVPPGDLAFDAGAALEASGVPASTVLGAAGDLAASSVFAISSDAGGTSSPDDAGPFVVCRPELMRGATASMCLGVKPGAWANPMGMPPGGLAVRRPIWIPLEAPPTGKPLAQPERAQLGRLLDALAFSRRMSQLGFSLTTLESVLPTADGAEITGRANEKEIVAVAVSSGAPTIHALTDGPSWTLDDAPRVIALQPGKSVRLRAIPAYTGAKREVWVWRR